MIAPLDAAALQRAQEHWNAIAKPLDGLGRLEKAIRRIAGLTGEILRAIETESDPVRACEKNVLYGADRIKTVFSDHPKMQDVNVRGAVYDIETGAVRWL